MYSMLLVGRIDFIAKILPRVRSNSLKSYALLSILPSISIHGQATRRISSTLWICLTTSRTKRSLVLFIHHQNIVLKLQNWYEKRLNKFQKDTTISFLTVARVQGTSRSF